MLFQREMVDRATGASPPWPSTKEMSTSPIKFNSSVLSALDDFYDCSTTINEEKRNNKEIIGFNEYVLLFFFSKLL